MPQSPPATADQKTFLSQQITSAQTDAVSSGNQIGLVGNLQNKYQNGQDVFTGRYGYWDTYILAYEAERKLLNGLFKLHPITQSDFNDFLATKGRLFKAGVTSPLRIAEFDNVGFSGSDVEPQNETAFLSSVTAAQGFLQSGFTAPFTLPPPGSDTYNVTSGFNNTSNSVDIFFTAATAWSIGNPGQLLLYTGSDGVIVNYVLVQAIDPLGTNRFSGLTYAKNFSLGGSIAVATSGPGFTNSERSSQTAPQQGILEAYMKYYLNAIELWLANLQSQVTQYNAEIAAGEDQPDTSVLTNLNAAITQLTNFKNTPDYSDTGLAAIAGLITTRTSQISARVSEIDARLIQQTKAYDERYKYATLLYDQATGVIPIQNKLASQKTLLAVRQSVANQQAVKLNGEIF